MSAESINYQVAGTISEVAASTYSSGEVIQISDGRAAIVANLTDVAVGDTLTLKTEGIVSLLSASATTFTKGDYVFWDASANLAITAPGDSTDFYVGVAVAAKANGAVVVSVDLNAVPLRGGLPLIMTREVELDHADTAAVELLSAAENPNGLILVAFTGIVTEAPAGSSEDQLVITLQDEDDTAISTLTTTDTTPDAIGDHVIGTLSVVAGATGGVAGVVAASKAVEVIVSQATAGTPAGKVKVHAIFAPRW